jgi:ELWxxDGT repeat protein
MHWLDSIHLRLFGSRRFRCHSKRSKVGKNHWRRLTLESLEDRLAPSASMVADLTVYTLSSYPSNLTKANGTLFFSATTSSSNNALFKSDGTAAGTVQLTFGTRLTGFGNFLFFNGKLFFDAYDTTLGNGDLWTSDGTVAGTVPFLAAGNNVGLYAQTLPVIAGNKFYFQAFDYSNGLNDLWVSDGTSAGTHPIQPSNSSDPTNIFGLTNVNGKLFFASVSLVAFSGKLFFGAFTSPPRYLKAPPSFPKPRLLVRSTATTAPILSRSAARPTPPSPAALARTPSSLSPAPSPAAAGV